MFRNIFSKFKTKNEDFQKFIIHSRNYTFSNIFLKGLTVLTMPILTRLLSPSDYGIISVYSSLVSIFAIVFTLGFENAQYRFYFENIREYQAFNGSNIIFLLFFVSGSFGLIKLFDMQIANMLNTSMFIMYLSMATAILAIPYTIAQTHFQCSENSKSYSLYSVTKYSSITIISIIIIVILSNDKYLGRIYAEVFVSIILLIILLPTIKRISNFRFEFKYLKYALKLSVPLIPHTASMFVLNMFDRVLINKYNGQTDVGLYSFAYNIGIIMNMFIISMNQSWGPIFYKKLSENNSEDIKQLFPKYYSIVLSIAVALILFSKEIVIVMGDKRYWESYDLIPIVVLSYLMFYLYTLYANYGFFYKTNLRISLFTIVSGFVNIILNVIFLPIYGYKFASVSTLVSFASLFLLHYINSKYIIKVNNIIELKLIYYKFAFVIVGVVLFYVVNYFDFPLLVNIIIKMTVTMILITFIIGKNKILQILN